MTSLSRVVVVVFALGLVSSSAEAARLAISGTSSGGGTLVNNGSGDVGTTDGSASGFTTAWSQMGLDSASDLLVFGSYTAPVGIDVDDTGQLTFLRVLATVPLPCSTPCSLLGDVIAGDLAGNNEDIQNVAWYADLLLLPGLAPLPAGGLTMNEGQVYSFGISALKATELDAIIALYGAANTRIGLSAAVLFPQFNDLVQGAPVFVTADAAVPEPGSLLLLGTGLTLIGGRVRRRFRRTN